MKKKIVQRFEIKVFYSKSLNSSETPKKQKHSWLFGLPITSIVLIFITAAFIFMELKMKNTKNLFLRLMENFEVMLKIDKNESYTSFN